MAAGLGKEVTDGLRHVASLMRPWFPVFSELDRAFTGRRKRGLSSSADTLAVDLQLSHWQWNSSVRMNHQLKNSCVGLAAALSPRRKILAGFRAAWREQEAKDILRGAAAGRTMHLTARKGVRQI